MKALSPLHTLYEAKHGRRSKLPPSLARLYGDLYLPVPRARPLVICNFVSTLDGLVSLAERGHEAAGEISGFDRHDRMVMGLLRALADVVIVGAGTLRVEPDHLWTAEYIFPDLRDAYAELRRALRKPEPPLNVVVSASGQVDPQARIFTSADVPALVVTTPKGASALRDMALPLARARTSGELSARTILSEALKRRPAKIVLVEGGPRLLGDFYAEHCIDQQFLTLAPQIAGRDHGHERPSLVMGKTFAPQRPLWTELLGVKRGDNHLFLRYQIAR